MSILNSNTENKSEPSNTYNRDYERDTESFRENAPIQESG